MTHRRALLAVLRARRFEGASLTYLERELQVSQPELRGLLAEAELRGEAVASGRGRWLAIEFTEYFTGTLRMTARGFGVLRSEDDNAGEIIIPPEGLATALDGDRVLVHRVGLPRRGGGTVERFARVVKILQRRRPTLVGRFHRDRGQAWVEPHARRLGVRIELEPWAGETPRDGEFVEVAVVEWGEGGAASGKLLRRLGVAGEGGVDEEVVLADLAIPVDFPPEAEREAAELPDAVTAADLVGRADFRHHPAVTIDGETAKDFDDAVVAFPAPDGAIEVFVHIADVSHYVRPGSALDAAARERGTSVYLPGRAVPMLPEKLSNHLCSLLPHQDRLSFSLRTLVTRDGALEGYRAERSVFRSRRRCTYTEVFTWLEEGHWPADLPADVKASLLLLDQAAQRLARRRQRRGAIDFDLPVPEILLDPSGFMTGVVAAERNRAHRLIEELMLAANECVARLLVWGRQPAIFRVHERPSPGKLAELQVVLEEFGVALKGNLEELPPRELQRVLSAIAGRPEERLLQTLILRSLARAAYHPECKGHYALATDFYLHFTSPIRRYPDLVVHRCLQRMLSGEVVAGPQRDALLGELEDIARHSSFTERRAEEAEREVVRWKQAEFMRAHIGEQFTGHVSGVTAFGLFVQLAEVFVEGLVHVSALRDDFYRYDEFGHRLVGQRHGRVFRLGDEMLVRVRGVNEERWEVELEPVLMGSRRVEGAAAAKPRGGGGFASSPAGRTRAKPAAGRRLPSGRKTRRR
jgi:ribonuclease R